MIIFLLLLINCYKEDSQKATKIKISETSCFLPFLEDIPIEEEDNNHFYFSLRYYSLSEFTLDPEGLFWNKYLLIPDNNRYLLPNTDDDKIYFILNDKDGKYTYSLFFEEENKTVDSAIRYSLIPKSKIKKFSFESLEFIMQEDNDTVLSDEVSNLRDISIEAISNFLSATTENDLIYIKSFFDEKPDIKVYASQNQAEFTWEDLGDEISFHFTISIDENQEKALIMLRLVSSSDEKIIFNEETESYTIDESGQDYYEYSNYFTLYKKFLSTVPESEVNDVIKFQNISDADVELEHDQYELSHEERNAIIKKIKDDSIFNLEEILLNLVIQKCDLLDKKSNEICNEVSKGRFFIDFKNGEYDIYLTIKKDGEKYKKTLEILAQNSGYYDEDKVLVFKSFVEDEETFLNSSTNQKERTDYGITKIVISWP